jgi:hypothetical protein
MEFLVDFIVNHEKKIKTEKVNTCVIPDIIDRLREKYNTKDIVITSMIRI